MTGAVEEEFDLNWPVDHRHFCLHWWDHLPLIGVLEIRGEATTKNADP